MKLAKQLASAAPFAHLLGLATKAKRAEEEDDDKKAKRAQEGDDEQEDKKESRADSDSDDVDADDSDESAEDDVGDDSKKDSKKSKKAKRAESEDDDLDEDDDQDDDEEDEDKSAKAARRAERARCKAIFESPSAGVRPDVAAHLAFNTNMSSKAAIAMLETVAAGGAAQPRSLAERMAKVKNTNVGADGGSAPGANTPAGVAAQIIAAGKKRRGES